MRDNEEQAPFLYIVPLPKGPDEGPEEDSDGHIASGSQRTSQGSFIHICLLHRVAVPQLDRGHTYRTPPALRTAPWTSPLGKMTPAAVIGQSSACSPTA